VAVLFRAGDSSLTATVNKPAGVVAGDVMYAYIISDGSPAACVGWQSLGNDPVGFGLYANATLLRKVAGHGEPASYTFTGVGALVRGLIVAFSGENLGISEDAATPLGAEGSVATVTATTISPSTDRAVHLIFVSENVATTFATPTNYDARTALSNNGTVAVFSREITPAATVSGVTFNDPAAAPAWQTFSVLVRPYTDGLLTVELPIDSDDGWAFDFQSQYDFLRYFTGKVATGGAPPPITGTAAITQATAVVAASGVESFVGTVAATQAVAVVAASGVEVFVGAAAITQATAAVSASGVTAFVGTAGITQATAVVAASGVEAFTGTGAATQQAASVAASGATVFVGTAAVTQATATVAASGVTAFVGTGVVTQAVATVAASGVESFTGTGAVTQATAVVSATGTSGGVPSRTGTASVTQARATAAATGTVVDPLAPPPVPPTFGFVLPERRVRQKVRGRAAIRVPAAQVRARGQVTPVVQGRAAMTQGRVRVLARGDVEDVIELEDELLLLGIGELERI